MAGHNRECAPTNAAREQESCTFAVSSQREKERKRLLPLVITSLPFVKGYYELKATVAATVQHVIYCANVIYDQFAHNRSYYYCEPFFRTL